MEITLKYGEGEGSFHLPSNRIKAILRPRQPSPTIPEEEVVLRALEDPISSPPLETLFRRGDRVALVVPDKTRRCRSELFLPLLIERMGLPDENIVIVLANGAHGLHREEEKRRLLGEGVYRRVRVEDHDAYAEGNLIYRGTTTRGTPIFINKVVAQADKVIITGGIVHHYFAGFGGGAKLIVPGVAGVQTIIKNHALSLSRDGFHPGCVDGKLRGNPVYEDILESLKFQRVDFLLNTILNEEGRIITAVAGDPVRAHLKGCEVADDLFGVPIDEKADLVIVSCGGYPKDVNFIQSHKSIQHAFYSLKEGGVMIVLAECSEGIGSETFLEWFNYPTLAGMKRALLEDFKLNGTTALSLRWKTERAKIILISGLEEEVVRSMGLIPATSLDQAMKIAERYLPENYKAYVIPNGSLTVPKLRANEKGL